MKRPSKRILLVALLLGAAYLGTYIFLRANGTLLVATDRKAVYKSISGKPSSGVMYSPLLTFYFLAYQFERLLPGKMAFGSTKYGVRYEGDYPKREAERMVRWMLDDIPSTASGFRGSYNCKFHDDDLVQTVQFRLDGAEWNRWEEGLVESMKRFNRAEEVIKKGSGYHADYGNSAGRLDVTFADSTVTVVRELHD